VCPGEQILVSKPQHDGENRHQRQIHERGFTNPPDDHTPAAAGEMADHDKAQRSQTDRQPEMEGKQQRAEGMARFEQPANEQQTQTDEPDQTGELPCVDQFPGKRVVTQFFG